MNLSSKIKRTLEGLSEQERDELYRYLWGEHVREDVITHAESIGAELNDDQIDIIVERYVEDGDYDCNLDYWTNIENLIDEVFVD